MGAPHDESYTLPPPGLNYLKVTTLFCAHDFRFQHTKTTIKKIGLTKLISQIME